MAHSSLNRTEVTFVFPTSGMTRGARVVAHIVFATCLTALVRLLISRGGRKEFGESIFTWPVVIVVSSRESVLMSTSSLVSMDVPEKCLIII